MNREQSQGLVWQPRHGTPGGNAQGLQPARAGSRCSSLCPGHPALAHLSSAELKLQQGPCSLLPHHAHRLRGSPRHPCLGTERAQELPQGPVTFQGRHGSFPQPRASSTPPFPCPQHGFGDQISSLLLRQRSPSPGLPWPGCPQPPRCLLWQPLPKPRCQRLLRSQLCSPVPHCSYLFLAAPRAPLGRDDAVSPVCWQLDE